jgi:hypothetical protein
VKLKVKLKTNMNKSLMLFLSVVGLALATANPGFARGDNLQLNSGTATRTANNHTGQSSPLNSSVGSYYLALAANHEGQDTTTATLNTSLAILAGVFTLMLLQRRNHANIVLRPRH